MLPRSSSCTRVTFARSALIRSCCKSAASTTSFISFSTRIRNCPPRASRCRLPVRRSLPQPQIPVYRDCLVLAVSGYTRRPIAMVRKNSPSAARRLLCGKVEAWRTNTLCSSRSPVNCPVNETLMIVAGERSGDIYGARLAAALHARLPEIEVFGCGGELMRGAGVETIVDSHEFAMVGITEVVSGLPRAYRGFHALLGEAERRRPELAILVDSPSLNIRLAKRLKNRGITVVYLISPQIWAWKRWRLGQLKTRIDKMLCIFDFEEPIYRQAGIPVEYVGHPLVDTVEASVTREAFFAQAGLDPDTPTVALLPGSREIEVSLI